MHSTQPLFTIATITYNSERWVKQAIESILASSFTDFEYLISDDCSTDGTWDVIQQYKDPRISAWRNEINVGEYQNRNKILKRAKGKYIFYIDGDDVLYKETLNALSSYVSYFPNAGMIWGIPIREVDFAILPYEFSPEAVTKFIYFTLLPFSMIGLSETVFKIELLRSIGGFNYDFSISDTFVKRKLATIAPVLMIPEGLSFWRRSDNQASKKASKNYKTFIDLHEINRLILSEDGLPLNPDEKNIATINTKISESKLLVKNTLFKGKLIDFIKLYKRLSFRAGDWKYLFRKGIYDYKPVKCISEPLSNNYHFERSRDIISPNIEECSK